MESELSLWCLGDPATGPLLTCMNKVQIRDCQLMDKTTFYERFAEAYKIPHFIITCSSRRILYASKQNDFFLLYKVRNYISCGFWLC